MITEQKKEYNRRYNLEHKEQIRAQRKGYYQAHKEERLEYTHLYNKKNAERVREKARAYYWENKSQQNKSSKEYRKSNPLKIKKLYRDWMNKNKEERIAYMKQYVKERRATDPMFRMALNLRVRTSTKFNEMKLNKTVRTEDLLGANYGVVKQHIENQFKEGMGWENYGIWEIDHIIPLSSAKDLDELIALCHYSNLQPLWGKENRKKGDNLNFVCEFLNENFCEVSMEYSGKEEIF